MAKRVIIIALVVMWLAVIFIFSESAANISGPQSRVVLEKGIKYTFKTLHKLGLTQRVYTDEQCKELSHKYLLPFRKLCHMTVYFVLGVFVAAAFRNFTKLRFLWVIVLTVIGCFVYAVTDEFHQTFVTGRSGLFMDCLVDSTGSLLGALFYALMHTLKLKLKDKIHRKRVQKALEKI